MSQTEKEVLSDWIGRLLITGFFRFDEVSGFKMEAFGSTDLQVSEVPGNRWEGRMKVLDRKEERFGPCVSTAEVKERMKASLCSWQTAVLA